jgi:hypothetical protein
MILIALSWLIMLLFIIPTGIAAKKLLKINNHQSYILIFLGLFIQCVFLSFCSFFCKLGLEVFILNFIIISGITIWNKKEIKNSYIDLIKNFKFLTKTSKFILFTIFITSLFKCAQSPFILDNEVYYLQTIKWINEYGFVKGLGNLHPFLGQFSSFHILQAGFNFNFLTNRINDINGFILLISSAYFISEFERRYKSNGAIHWIGFILVFNILFFQFINTPSPDLSIILLSQVLFYHFLDNENNLDNFKIATFLFLFMIFIKITIAPIGLIIVFMAIKQKKKLTFAVFLGTLIALLFIIKNYIISGYPLYPFDLFPLKSDWTIPKELLEFVSRITQDASYFKHSKIQNPTYWIKLNSWMHLGGINRIFNFGILFLFTASLFTKKLRQEIKYKILYIILLIHFIVLLFNAPQFRFFLPEFVFLTSLILSSIFNTFKVKDTSILNLLLIMIVVPILFVKFVDYKKITSNKLHHHKEIYKWSQIFLPEKNSKYATLEFEKIREGNLIFNSPKENFFFYGTADGDLPCVNKVQMNYLKKKYNYIPQLRKSDLGDGFYSKKISKNELNE